MSLRLALIGAGRMGAHHARVISQSPGAALDVVIDRDAGRAELVASLGGARHGTDHDLALGCDAAIVATNAETHADVAASLLGAGIPLLIEKPLSPLLGEARLIVETSRRLGVPVSCGFVERFNPVVSTARRLMHEDFGPALHLVGIRHSPPDSGGGLSVVHDLLIHDIDLTLQLCGGWTGQAVGGIWVSPSTATAEIADCTLLLAGGAVATCSASRMSQRKVRLLTLATERAMLELDLLRRTITVYQHVGHLSALDDAGYRAQTVMDLPFVREAGEPLALQLAHFLALVRGEADPDLERASLLGPHEAVAVLQDQAVGGLPWAIPA
ncbi:MAG TPA: Gfo/Idh/MocA family oxidoreductase [Actinomycetota bacterium]|jgi:predicted dehydrogenase